LKKKRERERVERKIPGKKSDKKKGEQKKRRCDNERKRSTEKQMYRSCDCLERVDFVYDKHFVLQ
jgi:hypothetical protein